MRSYVLGALGALTVIALFLGGVYLFGLPSGSLSMSPPTATLRRQVTPGMRLDAPGPPMPTFNPTVVQADRERQQRMGATEAAQSVESCREVERLYADAKQGRVWNRQQGPQLTETELQMLYGIDPNSPANDIARSFLRNITKHVYGCYGR